MKSALEEISAGVLKNVIKRIYEKQLELNTNSALKLLICCCTVCDKNEHEIAIRDLCSLIDICSTHIKELSDAELTNYLQCLYHILKYLIEKDFFVFELLKDTLPPKFLSCSILTKKQSQILIYTTNLIYNAVVAHVKQKNCTDSVILTANIISLKLFAKTSSPSEFLERIYKLLVIFAVPNANYVIVHDFIDMSFTIFKQKYENSERSDAVFRAFLSIIRSLPKLFAQIFNARELQRLIDASLIVLNEFCDSKEQFVLLKVVRNISMFISTAPALEDLQSSYNDFKSIVHLFGLTENVFAACQTISAMLTKACHFYYKNIDADFWNKTFTVEMQLVLSKILKKAAVFIEKNKTPCTCSETCKIKSGTASSIDLLYVVPYLCKFSLSRNTASKTLLKEALCCLEMSCTRLILLKETGCCKWKPAWTEIGCVFYNMGVVLYNSNNAEALLYFHAFIRFLIKFEGTETSVIKENALHTAMLCYTEMCNKLKDYLNAMKMAAFQIFLKKDDCHVGFIQWINAKSAIDDNQNVTVVDMLLLAEKDIKMILPEFNITQEVTEKLLVVELEHYKLRWPSKIPMMSAFKKLYECVGASKAARKFVKIWANSTLSVAEELTEMLSDLLREYEKTFEKSDFESNVIMACLYFCFYKYRMESVVQKNSSEIKKNTTSIKRPLPPYESPINSNDECDIATLCRHLSCESQIETKEFLDRALEIFEQHCNDISVKHLDFLNSFEIIEVLIRIGHEYQLHCYSTNYVRLWKIVLGLGKTMADDLLVLHAVTALLEFTDTKSELGIECVNLANNRLPALNSSENSAKKWETLTSFHIILSQKHLEAGNADAAFNEFQTAQECYKCLRSFSENELIKAKLLLLGFKFVVLPCGYKLVDHSNSTAVKIHQALKVVMNYFNRNGHKLPNAIALLFDISLAIGLWYRWLYLPREVRCYTRDVAVLSQQLVSPLRAARFLVVLAHADVLSCRIDACRAKILGINTILCLTKRYSGIKGDLEMMHVLSDELEELSLDLPLQKKRPPMSPVSLKSTFALPTFIEHPRICQKYCCNSVEYQELAIMVAHLEALMSLYTNDSSNEVQEYFEGSLLLLKNLEEKAQEADIFWEARANILLDYGKVLLMAGQRGYAEKINNDLMNLVSKRKLLHLYLFNAALFQKFIIMQNVVSSNVMLKDEEEADEDTVAIDGTPPKTPETKVNTVKIDGVPSPEDLPNPQYHFKKKLTFSLAEESSKEENTVKTPVKTPGLDVPSITVYPCVATTTKKKRPATTKKSKNKEVNNVLTEASASNSIKAEKLRSKTKLLTERIKRDAKDGHGTRARKNLMSELADAATEAKVEIKETERKGVATRKCSRNPKI